MREVVITPAEAGQRLDKFLHKYLKDASDGFLYKMLRKKNITLNQKKAAGGEKLCAGDRVCLFLSEETCARFGGGEKALGKQRQLAEQGAAAYRKLHNITVLYENAHILLLDKPTGVLSQKASPGDLSLNEWLIGYLLARGSITEASLQTFRPSVCNRLDRNTSGIVICGKSLFGAQEMTRILKDRSLHTYYLLWVEGQMREGRRLEGYLHKDAKTNQVTVFPAWQPQTSPIVTVYKPVAVGERETLVEAELITGKTHQIRAHLASAGFPLIGDYKYGNRAQNEERKRRLGITCQLLHAYKVVFPALPGPLEELSGREFQAPLPAVFLADSLYRPGEMPQFSRNTFPK